MRGLRGNGPLKPSVHLDSSSHAVWCHRVELPPRGFRRYHVVVRGGGQSVVSLAGLGASQTITLRQVGAGGTLPIRQVP